MKETIKPHRCLRAATSSITIMLALLVLTAGCTKQEAPRNSQVVDGVAIYLGVVPSQIVEGHPGSHVESKMHGGVPVAGHSDHVVVALFEDATGKRIEDAQVIGSIAEMGTDSDRTNFERMRIDGTITYGGYISNAPAGHEYHLKLRIQRPGNKNEIDATFSHVSLGN